MKLPAVAIAAAFCCGIALGLWAPVVHFGVSSSLLICGFALVFALIACGIAAVVAQRLVVSAVSAMFCWLLLGVLAAGIAKQPLPPDHILRLVEEHRIDLHSPLRWRGLLRDEPSVLPWGVAYDIDLIGVEAAGEFVPARGGLRLSYSLRPEQPAAPDLHAGDEISVLTQARRPQVFRNEGAFDRRAYLAAQNIELTASLRAASLLDLVRPGPVTAASLLARLRRRLREQLDKLFGDTPQVAGVLRAMLLGDRSFIDRDEAKDFQKTGVFHVLVLAGLHVGALAVVLFWAGRRMRLSPGWTILLILTSLALYIAVVEQRPPVLRAGLMAAAVVVGGFFYRRLELLNSAALAAILLLVARPPALRDSSFQLSFVAIGCIGGLALPWLARTAQPYARAMRGWRDVTRDAAHEPRAAQFRIDLRRSLHWISSKSPRRLGVSIENAFAAVLRLGFRSWQLFVLTLVLQIGMLPLMARDFHRITLAGPLVNLIAVPLTGLIVPLGFIAVTSSLFVAAVGRLLSVPLQWLTVFILHSIAWFAHFPSASYRIPGPRTWLMLAFFVVAILLAFALRATARWQRRATPALTCALLVCTGLVAWFPFSPQWSPGKLEATILDVGQGDAIFVVSPQGQSLLIDGGGAFRGFPGHPEHGGTDPGEDAISPYLWSRGFQKIDVVALTHAHQDHLGGLTAILENFRVGRLWIGREAISPALARLEEFARAKHIPIEHERRGQTFSWSGTEAAFFWPGASSDEIASTAKNNDSLVFRLRYGNRTILLPGDAEKDAERTMLADDAGEELRADVLKVGHHGSKNSTMPDFLAAVRPQMAIISAGEENPYGHPSPALLARLQDAGVSVYRTDRDGAVRVVTDGESLTVSCFVACPALTTREALRQTQSPNDEQQHEQQ